MALAKMIGTATCTAKRSCTVHVEKRELPKMLRVVGNAGLPERIDTYLKAGNSHGHTAIPIAENGGLDGQAHHSSPYRSFDMSSIVIAQLF